MPVEVIKYLSDCGSLVLTVVGLFPWEEHPEFIDIEKLT